MKHIYISLALIYTSMSFGQSNLLNAKTPEQIGLKNQDQKITNDKPLSYGYVDERDVLQVVNNKLYSSSNLIDIGKSIVIDNLPVDCPTPSNLDELDGGYAVFYSSRNYTMDTSGAIFYVSAGVNKAKQELTYKFLQYKKSKCIINGVLTDVIFGCGVELELRIISNKKSLNITSLPSIAAAVQYKDAEIQFKLNVLGVTGNAVRNNLAFNGSFDVENYGKIMVSIDKIIENMSASGTKISPQIIADINH